MRARQQGRLVDQVGQVGSNKARSDRRDLLKIHVRCKLDVLYMHFEDVFPATHVGPVDEDLAIKPAGPQQGGIKHLGPVRRCRHNHTAVRIKPVHLDQQGIQGLFTFVVTADHPRAAGFAQRV